MANGVYRAIIELVAKAAELARTIGINNLLQPGLIKEMIIADILGHDLIHSKRDADAQSRDNPAHKYEYLSCKEGVAGQIDRMFKTPVDKRAASLSRITRNHKVFFAVFYAANQMKCKIIYELEPKLVLAEANRQLDCSANPISHIGFSESWAKANGKVVYEDKAFNVKRGGFE